MLHKKSLADASGYEISRSSNLVRPQAAQVELRLALRFGPGVLSLNVDYDVANRFTGHVHLAAGQIIASPCFGKKHKIK